MFCSKSFKIIVFTFRYIHPITDPQNVRSETDRTGGRKEEKERKERRNFDQTFQQPSLNNCLCQLGLP